MRGVSQRDRVLLIVTFVALVLAIVMGLVATLMVLVWG